MIGDNHLDLLELGADVDAFFALAPDIDAPPEPPGSGCPLCTPAGDRLEFGTRSRCHAGGHHPDESQPVGVAAGPVRLRMPFMSPGCTLAAALQRKIDIGEAHLLLVRRPAITARLALTPVRSIVARWSLRARPPPRTSFRPPVGRVDKENAPWRCQFSGNSTDRVSNSPQHNADQRLPPSQGSTAVHRSPNERKLAATYHARLPRRQKSAMAGLQCIVCCPLPYVGSGWTETCVRVIAGFPSAGLSPVLVTPRARKSLPERIEAVEALPFPLSRLPWSMIERQARERLDKCFVPLLRDADPDRTVAYFWPGSPQHLIRSAREKGILSVREMINTSMGTAKRILDSAYAKWGLTQAAPITWESAESEKEELQLYDYIVAPGPGVEQSLRDAGVDERRILPASYGWFPARFAGPASNLLGEKRTVRVLFVGMLCVRKGVPELLQGWERSGVDGELILVGDVEPVLRPFVDRSTRTGRVRHFPYSDAITPFYRESDIFVFPSLEEGCPQVTMEAGGCGLPVIATPMGGGRIVQHGKNGLIVPPGDIEALALALRRLANDADLRRRYGARISEDAQKFTYERVSAERGATMARLLDQRATGKQQ